MASVIESINNIREEKIVHYYNAALAELEEKVKAEPLNTLFYIYSGCVSEEIAKEIAHRLSSDKTEISVSKGGIFMTTWYLTINIKLPETLIHEETAKISSDVEESDSSSDEDSSE
jgi:hypothetical protein